MNEQDLANQRQATLRSICDVPGAVVMEQIVSYHPAGGARLVTISWIDVAHRVLRRDEVVLVDPLPIVSGVL